MRIQKHDPEMKAGYNPTAKKYFNSSMFQNSKEFTQMGTLAKENRIAEYYQPDITPQPKPLQDAGDLAALHGVRKQPHPIGNDLRRESLQIAEANRRLIEEKHRKDEQLRKEEADQFVKPGSGPSDAEYDFLRMEYLKDKFPATTNQDFLT